MTFISIIIPFNKGQRYLKDCLDSLVNQDLKDHEIILVLNGVRGDLTDLVNEYDGKLNLIIKEFPDEINVGKARNVALDMASGEYVYFMDSDDYLHDDGLAKLIDACRRTGADFINGERIKTYYIRERFSEELEKPNVNPLNGSESSQLFLIRLIVGKLTDEHELMSALHCLIKRDLICDVRFDEDNRYFTDYMFMIDVIDKIESFCAVENAVYAKRIRDDSINLTSLNQEIEGNDFSLFLKQYMVIRNILDEKTDGKFKILKSEILKKLHKFYYHTFSKKYVRDSDERWRMDYIGDMSEIAKDFGPELITIKDRLEIKALQQGDWQRYDKLVKIRWGYVKAKQIKHDHWLLNPTIYDNLLNKPIKKNKLLFESFYGRYYSDSPKYIYEYLLENHEDEFEMVWVLDDSNVEIPGNPKKVKRFSRDYYKHLSQSEYYIFNTRHPDILKKKTGQKYISTWHGTPLKRLGYDIDNVYVNNPNIKESYGRSSKMWDYMISPNRYTTEILRSAFSYEGEIIESGYPRNDILYNASQEDIDNIKKSLNLPNDKKIILYAPTFRDDEQIDAASVNFSLELDLKKLKEALSDEYIILLRMHYFIANNLNIDEYEGFAFDVSDYEDIAELYLISDLLITDYSSVFFDYANLKRPILFFTYDLEKYENVLRGFYIDIHTDVPGPLLKTNDELIESILNIDSITDEYSDRYDEFYQRFCSIDDGNASKRIYEKIWSK